MKLGPALLISGVLVACSSEQSSAPSGTETSSSSGGTPTAGARPPAGIYDVTVATRSSTCGEVEPVSTASVFVSSRPRGDKQIASLPVGPVGNPGQARIDTLLQLGQKETTTSRPAAGCDYTIERDVEVTEVTTDKVSVIVRSDFGKAEGCSPVPTPASCKEEATMTFVLREKFCEPDCAADVRVTGDRIEKTGCRCGKQ
ncbi:MAG: hypothetical protein HOV80_16190 [Polyangiaceae bacterium]|nr:hypothetical protein [Polyangiaceae bacterium]